MPTSYRSLEQARQVVHETDREREQKDRDKRTLERLKRYLREVKAAESRWRPRCQESLDFYYLRQWKPEDLDQLEARKQAPIVIDEVSRTVDLVLGLHAVDPMDWVAKPVGQSDSDISEPATAAMKHIHEVNHGRQTFLDTYAWAIKYGYGVIATGFHIARPDPREEPVQFFSGDPREFSFDPRMRQPDNSDARFCAWRPVVSLEAVKAAFPQAGAQIEEKAQIHGTEEAQQGKPQVVDRDAATPPESMWDKIDWNQAEKGQNEWQDDGRDEDTKEVILTYMWEKYLSPAWLGRFKGGYTRTSTDENEVAAWMMDPKLVRVEKRDLTKVRYHVFTGDILLLSENSPYTHDRLPYVFIFHGRDDKGDPVSLIEGMKDPQREVNHRRSRLLWELLARSVRVSPRALTRMGLSREELEVQSGRPGAVFEAEKDELELLPRGELAHQQFDLMQDATRRIHSAAGMNEDLIGNQTTSRSGLAKQVAASQGQLSLRPKQLSLRFAHKLVGQIVWQLIQQAHDDEWVFRLTDETGSDIFYSLNERGVDPATGMERVLNDIRQVGMDIEFDATAWSPTQAERTSELLLSLAEKIPDPGMRMRILALAIVAGDIPKKAAVMQIIRDLLNPPTPITPTPRPPTVSMPYRDLPPDVKMQVEAERGYSPSQLHGLPGVDPNTQPQQLGPPLLPELPALEGVA